MDDEECRAVLRAVGWGVLAVAEEGAGGATPVAVPVAYAFDESSIYLALGPGRKLRALERNPGLCLTVTDVHDFDRWRSVAVVGRASWVVDAPERIAAIAAFAGQRRPHGGALGRRDLARLLAARLLRVESHELRGFVSGAAEPAGGAASAAMAGEAPAADAAAGTVLALAREPGGDEMAGRAMDSLRRVVRALRATEGTAERELGVSAAQLFVLWQLADGGRLSMKELARRTATAQSSVSEVAARLVARGLVSRTPSPADRRRMELALTDEGRELLRRAPQTAQEHLLAGFRHLPQERQRMLAAGLEAWLEAAGLGDLAATMFFEPLLEAP